MLVEIYFIFWPVEAQSFKKFDKPISVSGCFTSSFNIFGGIVRCDLIAEGIIAAINEVGVEIPVVVRLEGNNADIGSDILQNSGIEIKSINNLADAAKAAVELSK